MTDLSAITKVLFMDIDGVTNSARTGIAFGGRPRSFAGKDLQRFDWTAVGMIRALCAETGAVVVLSSSWRERYTAAQVAAALELNIVDAIPTSGKSTAANIVLWLDDHPEVRKYAIVDDVDGFFANQQRHLVLTSDVDGLTCSDYKKLKALLQ